MSARVVLHLVRHAAPPPEAVADRDWVVYLHSSSSAPGTPGTPELAPHGAPPLPPGPIDHAQLVLLSFAAALVVTW